VLPVIKYDLFILQNIHFSVKRIDRTMMDFRINMITSRRTDEKAGSHHYP
jgi:hypothetical protein